MSDRITLYVTGLDDLSGGFDSLASEVLATRVIAGPGDGPATALELDDDRVALAWIVRVETPAP